MIAADYAVQPQPVEKMPIGIDSRVSYGRKTVLSTHFAGKFEFAQLTLLSLATSDVRAHLRETTYILEKGLERSFSELDFIVSGIPNEYAIVQVESQRDELQSAVSSLEKYRIGEAVVRNIVFGMVKPLFGVDDPKHLEYPLDPLGVIDAAIKAKVDSIHNGGKNPSLIATYRTSPDLAIPGFSAKYVGDKGCSAYAGRLFQTQILVPIRSSLPPQFEGVLSEYENWSKSFPSLTMDQVRAKLK